MKHLLLATFLYTSLLFSQEHKEHLTVYFNSGSTLVSDKDKSELDAFFSNKGIRVVTVSITGYCDDIGSGGSNLLLSQKRAESVVNLLQKDFSFDTISASGAGEISLDKSGPPDQIRALNRRAVISVVYLPIQDQAIPEDESVATPEGKGYKTFDDILEAGDKVIINHLLFEGSRTRFLDPEEAEAELSKIVDYFKKNPTVQFEIQGHVCCISSAFKDARNLETGLNNLSKARAQKIYEFFISKGIAKERMTHEGYGRQFPRKDVMESLNKRVEIVITKL